MLFYAEDMGIQVLFGGMNDVDKCIQDNGDGTYTVLPPADSSIEQEPGSGQIPLRITVLIIFRTI